MSLYINSKNEYPRHIGDVQIEHPDWKFGDTLPEGWHEVAEADPSTMPIAGEGQGVEETFPTLIDGVFTQTFIVRDLTEEEIAANAAPETAKQRLLDLGFSEIEIFALKRMLI